MSSTLLHSSSNTSNNLVQTCVFVSVSASGAAGSQLETQKCHEGLIVAVLSIKELWSEKTHYCDIKEVWDVLVNQRETCRGTTDDVLCVRGLNVTCTTKKKPERFCNRWLSISLTWNDFAPYGCHINHVIKRRVKR